MASRIGFCLFKSSERTKPPDSMTRDAKQETLSIEYTPIHSRTLTTSYALRKP